MQAALSEDVLAPRLTNSEGILSGNGKPEEMSKAFATALSRRTTQILLFRHEHPVQLLAFIATLAFACGMGVRLWRSS